MRKLKITLFFAMAVLLCAAGSALAGTATLSSIEDSYVWDDDLDGNYGAQNYMIVGEWDGASPYGTCRSYLMFDLSSIPAGQTITSATLHLSCKTLYNSNAVTGAHFLSDDTWDEYTITWRNVTTAFNAVATDTTSIAVGDNTWNVLSDVSIEYAGDKVYSVVMKLPNEGVNADGAWLHSKEYAVASEHPTLVVDYQDDPGDPDKDYGDAPEGVIAYPSLGITGNFPTCITVGPAGYVEHGLCWAHFEMIPPPGFDFETDGNGGLCPGFAPYDNDECFMDGDAGLIMPDPYTIQAGTVVACPNGAGTALGQAGSIATWGANADIYIVNNMPVDGFVNVLMDWDQNGAWGVPGEHIVVNLVVPVGYAGPLSALGPAPFTIGPNSGFVWTRFMISESQVAVGWDGSGIFEDGETEDYLLRIDPVQQDLDFGDAPDSAAAPGYPTLSGNSGANHVIDLTKPWLGTLGDAPDAEPDGQPDATATGDDLDGNDDEDGVAFFTLVPGSLTSPIIDVHDPAGVGGPGGILEIWIDYDFSNSWEASELAFSGLVNHGQSAINITVPTGLTSGTTFARCRISTAGTGSPTGQAADGEVEDYEVLIEEEQNPDEELKFQQLPLNGPEYFGHDELSTAYRDPDLPIQFEGCYMADDFADLKDTPVIKIKWWGSYLENEQVEPIMRFLIAFEADIPAVGQPGDVGYVASHPGLVLSTQFVNRATVLPLNPGEYSETLIGPGGSPCFEALYEYEAVLANPFPQEPDTVYWLKIVALIDDIAVLNRMKPALTASGLPLCQFLNLPYAQQAAWGLQVPVTRWGWHNRDYTIMDLYASVPPAVVPGENNQGPLSNGNDVWHFQDDAVSGEMFIDESDPIMPTLNQYSWQEEYYKYSSPLCAAPPPGVDGPEDIQLYSKDLAFELWTPWTPTECVKSDAPFYTEWVGAGKNWDKPDCWCYEYNCRGDADGVKIGLFRINSTDLGLFADAYNKGDLKMDPVRICSDFDHIKVGLFRVNSADLGIFATNYNKGDLKVAPCPLDWDGDTDDDYNFWLP